MRIYEPNKNFFYLKILSRDILSKKSLKKINTRLELIELIKKYYKNYNKDLELEKILLKSSISENKELNFFSKISMVITLITTLSIFLISHKEKINESQNKFSSYNLIGFVLIFLLAYFLWALEIFLNSIRKHRRIYLELRIDIINNIKAESLNNYKNKTNEEFLTFYQENIS